ncbi:vWA domain-containing protein [Roseovarius amoyensis]|uniref:vWA domain-containing protein n=1 Tax=Roseovarius amoyensis TaxID=2211448 RepID=UPI000DBE3844|nr:VWA domain-containing protein [Roseovarius amoyensis]
MSSMIKGAVVSASLTLAASSAMAQENVMVVFDGSNSMWGQIDGTAKIEIARDVMETLLGDWTDDRAVGLMAYGHRRRGDCGDIETLVQPGAGSRAEILDKVRKVKPTGKTPLTAAVERAARDLSYTDQPATVVLISDGLESCDRDPCALARTLEQGGVRFTAHVVGFGLGADQDDTSLACIAEETGGTYIQASNADELKAAMSSVSTAVAAAAPEPEPEPAAEPEPEPQPALPEVAVTGPGTAVGGSMVEVTWDPTIDEDDYITIVPMGADEGVFGPYQAVRSGVTVGLDAPAREGIYEIRYVHRDGNVTQGRDTLEITPPEVALDGPDKVLTGAEFALSWTPTINPRDYVTIVPAGAEPGSYLSYVAVRGNSEATLTAPPEPGLYELRYVLNVDQVTVASRSIEVAEPEVTLNVPERALAGAKFPVGWTGTINGKDYITIVPQGTKEGEYGNYFVVRDKTEHELQAPAETGLYEVRYVLREGGKTMASAPIEIAEGEVTVSAPDTATAGAKFEVSWTGTVNGNDYIAIVPQGTKEGEYGNYFVVRDKTEHELQAPAETGLYEVRYVLREGGKTLASTPIEIVEGEVTVSAPDTAAAGAKFPVSWTGTVNANDYIGIVPQGTKEGEYGNYFVVRGKTDHELQAPAETGLYEVRYVLREGGKTLASTPIEIVAPEVTVSAPETALAGAAIPVSWTGTVAAGDYMAIVPAGADEGEFGNYITVRDKAEAELRAPAVTGLYEVRYILREGSRTLATAMIEIVEPEVTVSGPDQVRATDKLRVTWTGTVDRGDYVALAPIGSADDDSSNYFTVRDNAEHDMTAPPAAGLYELRYILREGGRVLARKPVEVLAEDAALNTGATLSAPETAAAGSKIEVSWESDSDSADRRITVAAPDQAIFTWIEAVKIAGAPPVEIALPDGAGAYELRLLDVSNKAVLARRMITVE